MIEYIERFHELQFSNGMFASKAAAFVAVLSLSATWIFAWRLWLMRGEVGSFRFRVFLWLVVLFGSLAGNRIAVVLFYRGMTSATDYWPTLFSVGMGAALLVLAHLYTRDYCGHRGWLSALALASAAMLLA